MQEKESMKPLKEGEVRPQEPTTVYATGTSRFYKEGQEIIVHRALADKLIARGKATKTAPKAEKGGGKNG